MYLLTPVLVNCFNDIQTEYSKINMAHTEDHVDNCVVEYIFLGVKLSIYVVNDCKKAVLIPVKFSLR